MSGSYVPGSANESDARAFEESFKLPLSLFCQIVPPESAKESNKLTLITDLDTYDIQ